MRRTLLHSLLPAAVAIMMSLGIVMTAAAEPDSNSSAALVPGGTALDQLVELGVLPSEARTALMLLRLEHSEHVSPGALCRRVANADNPPASLVERCRTWLSSQSDDGVVGRFAVCRGIANAESVDASLVERCRAILADAPGRHSDVSAHDARPERAGEANRPVRDVPSTIR